MLKRYNQFLNESIKDIDSICNQYDIKNYTINADGSIDVDGRVNLSDKLLTNIPLRFRNVNGDFYCSNNKLATLEGAPISVHNLFCSNNKLTSLKGCPKELGIFYCSYNQLTTLEDGPDKVHTIFCDNNKIKSFVGCPEVSESINIINNQIETLEGLPNSEIDISLSKNPVFQLWHLFKDISKVELFNEYDIIRIENGERSVVLDRLNSFLEDIGEDPVEDIIGYKNI